MLLQKTDPEDADAPWTLVEEDKLKKLVTALEKINLVYDYFHHELKKHHSVSYAEVKELRDFKPIKETVFAWFSHKEITKLKISKTALQDLIVGQRVIDSQVRKDSGERTIG